MTVRRDTMADMGALKAIVGEDRQTLRLVGDAPPELRAGEEVTIVPAEQPAVEPAAENPPEPPAVAPGEFDPRLGRPRPRTLLELISGPKPKGAFQTVEEVDEHIRKERASWDRPWDPD